MKPAQREVEDAPHEGGDAMLRDAGWRLSVIVMTGLFMAAMLCTWRRCWW